jgi:hypothetical protein
VAFAKTSRSPESFRDIAAQLSDEKSAQFHEKWVVGYGHASVAEHAVLHIAVENVSRLAIEALESGRLASYTEKSTRYQVWGPQHFYTPRRIAESGLADLYRDTVTGFVRRLPALTCAGAPTDAEPVPAQRRRERNALGRAHPLEVRRQLPLLPARRSAGQRGRHRQCAGA